MAELDRAGRARRDDLACGGIDGDDGTDGDLAAYLNHGAETELTEELIRSHFPDAKSFIADLERWYKLFKGMGIAKRIQAPPILAVTRRAYGFDYRESAIQPYFTRKYLEMKERIIG